MVRTIAVPPAEHSHDRAGGSGVAAVRLVTRSPTMLYLRYLAVRREAAACLPKGLFPSPLTLCGFVAPLCHQGWEATGDASLHGALQAVLSDQKAAGLISPVQSEALGAHYGAALSAQATFRVGANPLAP